MVQVIQRQPKPQFDWSKIVGLGAQTLQGYMENKSQEKKMAKQLAESQKQLEQENEFLKKEFDIDVSGIRDPKVRLQAISEQLKGKEKRKAEEERFQKLSEVLGIKEPTGLSQDFDRMPEVDQNIPEWMRETDESGVPFYMQDFEERPRPKSAKTKTEGQIDLTNIPDEAILSIPNAEDRRFIQNAKDQQLKIQRSQRELALREKIASPEHVREKSLESSQAQADVKYNQQLQEASKQHALKEQTLDRLEALNKKGVTGKPYEKLLEKMGLVNLTSEGRREFAADVKNLITDIRSILGAQFTGFEFQTILNAYPSADFSKGANEAIIRNLKDFQDIKSKEVQFANDIKKENGGKIPFDFQSQVNERVQAYAQAKIPQIKENTRRIMNAEYGLPEGHTLMFDPNGEELSVPEKDIVKYMELGATLP